MYDRSTGDAGASRSAINDCWNKIGVHGDASCPELEQHAHCRNCPIYSAAAVTLLERDIPADYLADRSSHFAKANKIAEAETHSVFIFRIAAEWLALPTSILDEVTELRAIHSLPHRRNSIALGLANVRGQLLICVSLGKMLGLEKGSPTKHESDEMAFRRLVVICHEGHRMAFPVNDAHGIHRYHPRELKAVPATVAKAAASYTKAILPWREHSVGCLDDQLLVQALNRNVA